jgi:hypothetical protein
MNRAVVVSSTVETTYARYGVRGPTVLYLGHGHQRAAHRAQWLEALGESCTVIVPEAMSPVAMLDDDAERHAPFTRWLLGVFDGLGIGAAWLVVEAPFVAAADAFARQFPERVLGPSMHTSDDPQHRARVVTRCAEATSSTRAP